MVNVAVPDDSAVMVGNALPLAIDVVPLGAPLIANTFGLDDVIWSVSLVLATAASLFSA